MSEHGDVIRVFIGAPPDGLDAESQCVVEYTMRTRSSLPIEITWMTTSQDPESFWYGWDLSDCVTPFTPYRFSCPQRCEFKGRCLYMDVDMIVLCDLAELYNIELEPRAAVAARGYGSWRFDVMLMDCAKIKPHMLPLETLKSANGFRLQNSYFHRNSNIVHSLGAAWNYLDDDTLMLRKAKIVHYSNLRTQPSRVYAVKRLAAEGREHWYRKTTIPHPRREFTELFHREYAAAVAAGYEPSRYYTPAR